MSGQDVLNQLEAERFLQDGGGNYSNSQLSDCARYPLNKSHEK